MNGDNYNTLSHAGTYRTRIERQENGALVIVQVSKHGETDCVMLPPDLVTTMVSWLKPSRKRSVA